MQAKLVTSTSGHAELEGKSLDEIIVAIARVSSSKSTQEKFDNPEKLIRYCWRNGHVSIFEQVNLGFEITTSLAISHQVVRHRAAKFQQFSRRYSSAPVEFEPVVLRRAGTSNRQGSLEEILGPEEHALVDAHLAESRRLYELLLARGAAAESARFVLPVATQTALYMSNDARCWIHYIQNRTASHAQAEHREIAEAIKAEFVKNLPIVSAAVWGES